MSRKKPPNQPKPIAGKAVRKPDARVLRTRNALGDAMIELMQEQPFESITVQHVLDRAGIGRSTFYSHYSDKNDLFLSDVEDFWEKLATLLERRKDSSNRVAPVCELFAHVGEVPQFYAALVASGKVHDVMELGQGHFARAIERGLAARRSAPGPTLQKRVAAPKLSSSATPYSVMAQALAGALFSLLAWWIKSGKPFSAGQMDDLFHQLVWQGAAAPVLRDEASVPRATIRLQF